MSDEIVRLSDEQMKLVDSISMSFVHVLSSIVGHDMAAVIVLAPTTQDVDPKGKTQVQVISNMTPAILKKTLKDLNTQLGDKEIAELQAKRDKAGVEALLRSLSTSGPAN